MDKPFSDKLCIIADNMGISLYSRFSITEAALFLRCPISNLQKLSNEHKIGFTHVPRGEVEFFGYQLLEYFLSSVTEVARSRSVSPNQQERIIRTQEVQKITGLSRTTIWRLERKGELPNRVPLAHQVLVSC